MFTVRFMILYSFIFYPERYIITVSPKKDTPVLLASPGWPRAMKPYSTVSWIVSVPADVDAQLTFANLSQPKCLNHHTDISVQRVGRLAVDYSRREDEEADGELTVCSSFYLNMSNCRAERGQFSVITKITLQAPKSEKRSTCCASQLSVHFFIQSVKTKAKWKILNLCSLFQPSWLSSWAPWLLSWSFLSLWWLWPVWL